MTWERVAEWGLVYGMNTLAALAITVLVIIANL